MRGKRMEKRGKGKGEEWRILIHFDYTAELVITNSTISKIHSLVKLHH